MEFTAAVITSFMIDLVCNESHHLVGLHRTRLIKFKKISNEVVEQSRAKMQSESTITTSNQSKPGTNIFLNAPTQVGNNLFTKIIDLRTNYCLGTILIFFYTNLMRFEFSMGMECE